MACFYWLSSSGRDCISKDTTSCTTWIDGRVSTHPVQHTTVTTIFDNFWLLIVLRPSFIGDGQYEFREFSVVKKSYFASPIGNGLSSHFFLKQFFFLWHWNFILVYQPFMWFWYLVNLYYSTFSYPIYLQLSWFWILLLYFILFDSLVYSSIRLFDYFLFRFFLFYFDFSVLKVVLGIFNGYDFSV